MQHVKKEWKCSRLHNKNDFYPIKSMHRCYRFGSKLFKLIYVFIEDYKGCEGKCQTWVEYLSNKLQILSGHCLNIYIYSHYLNTIYVKCQSTVNYYFVLAYYTWIWSHKRNRKKA